MILSDLHIHSKNSFDAETEVSEICEIAVNTGLFAVAVTDHCEAPMIRLGKSSEYGCFDETIPNSLRQTARARLEYSGRLKVLSGIELGEPTQDPECTKKALSYGEYDFILASLHNLKGKEDFYFLDYSSIDVDELLKAYFNELAETALFKEFDSLAHLTYPLRYIRERTGVYPDLSPYQDVIDDIYRSLISAGKALEINTSGLFKPIGCTLPDERQIKRYRRLGGKYITLGSDAHTPAAVGQGIERGLELAKECGFEHYTVFEKRVPKLVRIDGESG